MEMSTELLMVFVLDWVEFALRWLHVITAIAWIGSSFYFIALDLGLWRDRKLPEGPMVKNGRFMAAGSIISRNIWWPQKPS